MEETDKHFHKYTLTLKDEDLEYEWRLHELASRKRVSMNMSILAALQTIVWTMILGETTLTGKIVKLGINALVFFCLAQAFYLPRVKENKKVLDLVSSGDTNLDKWEEVQLKLGLQKESQR